MAKASETSNVCECAANEMLRTSLPVSVLAYALGLENVYYRGAFETGDQNMKVGFVPA